MSYETIEAALVSRVIADSALFTTDNLLARNPRGAVQWLQRNFAAFFAGYTLYGGGQKKEKESHVWTWHIKLEFLIRGVKVGDPTEGEGRVLELQDSIGITSWRLKSRLGGACLRSAVAQVQEPVIVSFTDVDYYLLSLTVDADEDYSGLFG